MRDAVALARAFDEAVARRGYPRAKSRSLVAHAEALVAQKTPIGPLALEVAHRWAAARFGEQPLSEEELSSLKRALVEFVDPTPTEPPRAARCGRPPLERWRCGPPGSTGGRGRGL